MDPRARRRAALPRAARRHDTVTRALQAERDGIDRIAIAPSSPLGIEALPPEEAAPLLAAYHEGILELGAPFHLWASGDDPRALGGCLPAAALASPEGLDAVSGALSALEDRGAPLFVHPGAADPDLHGPTGPCWWALLHALTETKPARLLTRA